MYVYNRYKRPVYVFHVELNIRWWVGMAPETLDMGGAPPHTDTRIRPAACGRVQNRTV